MIKIPKKEDYEIFMNEFVGEFSKIFPDSCFYTFGSTTNGHCVYGRSDIDGGIILNSGIITSKKDILKISYLLSKCKENSGIKTQFNLLDLQTCQDGRFLSYTRDYTEWLKQRAVVQCGPNFVEKMNGYDFKSGHLHSASMNFCGPSGVRNILLDSTSDIIQPLDEKRSKDVLNKNVSKALEKVAKFPKKLIWLKTGNVTENREDGVKKLETILEDVDFTLINQVNTLLDNPKYMINKLSNQRYAIRILKESLECMEQMIESYIRHFPNLDYEREARG